MTELSQSFSSLNVLAHVSGGLLAVLPLQQTGNKHPSCGDPMVKSVSQLLLGASAPDKYS